VSYRFLDHTTDAIIEVSARDLREAFVTAADATIETTLNRSSVSETGHMEFTAEGENLYHLLFSWLEEIIFVLITKGFAIKRVGDLELHLRGDAEGHNRIQARAYGEPLDLSRHGFKVEIKAPTFHDMRIVESNDNGVQMRFLLDL